MKFPRVPVVKEHEGIKVVRDDLVPGGTKHRSLLKVLPLLGYSEFCFSAPAVGYAQIALAYACQELGYSATIFVAKRRDLHPRTQLAKGAGAKIVQVPFGRLSVIRAVARRYVEEKGALLFPMGFAIPEMEEEFYRIAMKVDFSPKEVWSVAGSGTLCRALQRAWPSAKHSAVQIGFPPSVGDACLYKASERFEEDADYPPPFPSCSNYDAKAWRFVIKLAGRGSLFWNVAG